MGRYRHQGLLSGYNAHDLDSLPALSGFLLHLSEPTPQLRPLNAETIRAAREALEPAPADY